MINRNTVSKAISAKQLLLRNMCMKENFSRSFYKVDFSKRYQNVFIINFRF